MTALSQHCPLVPVVTKSDVLTPEEQTHFKRRIQADLSAAGITLGMQPLASDDADERARKEAIRVRRRACRRCLRACICRLHMYIASALFWLGVAVVIAAMLSSCALARGVRLISALVAVAVLCCGL